jgi:transcriptional regulator with XRE-family HTH domain
MMLTLKSYNEFMSKTFGEWLFEKILEYEKSKKRRVTQTEFARYLGVSQATLSNWMNESSKPSAQAALKLAALFDEYEVLSILGYPLPEGVSDFSLPPALRESFDKALDEIEREYKVRGITDLSSEEALAIAKEILEVHGWTVTT